jgi:hypothetical protein
MKRCGNDSTAWQDRVGRDSPTVDINDNQPRRRGLRLSPLAAIGIAFVGFALVTSDVADTSGFAPRNAPACSPEQAVDMILQRLTQTRIAHRLQREGRLSASLLAKQGLIDAEVERIRVHPLYVMMKEKMIDHLWNEGYDRVPMKITQDSRELMLSVDAQATIQEFMYSLYVTFPAPNDKVATFLKDQEKVFGQAVVACRAGKQHDALFTFLIQLLSEYPDDLEPVAGAFGFFPRPREEIERVLYGERS